MKKTLKVKSRPIGLFVASTYNHALGKLKIIPTHLGGRLAVSLSYTRP
jgi:hypothetical protein